MFEDYFALQLEFADRYATVAGVRCDMAIAHCTNLRRRMNLGGPAGAARWNEFLAKVRRLETLGSTTLSMCLDLYETRPRADAGLSFGCFSFDPPDCAGTLRIHFMPPDNTHSSPLAATNADVMRSALRELFRHVRRTERTVASVQGISWLYNLEAYRRLFPPSYVGSAHAPQFPLHLNGSSTWGQVLNWRQEVKPAMRDAVLAGLPTMKGEAPWEIFPYRALVAFAAIDAFYDFFD